MHDLPVPEEFNRRVIDRCTELILELLTPEEIPLFIDEVWNSGEPRRSIVTEEDGTQRVHVSIERPNGEVIPVARFRLAAIGCMATESGLLIL